MESAVLVSMSLNSLLSFVPPVRRQTTSGASLIFFSFNLLTMVWGFMLLLSVAVLCVFALLTSRAAFFGSTSARDAEIQSIKSVTDIGLLQQKAIFDVSQSYAASATATFLCHIALDALLLMVIGSIGGLLLVRWMKRHLRTGDEEIE